MMRFVRWGLMVALLLLFMTVNVDAAYHHGGDTDSEIFKTQYPETIGTKLDNCATCHSGGEYEKKPGVWIEMGSCQWCHYTYGYDGVGDIDSTLNGYGRDYLANGRDSAALALIADLNSDGDGYSNADEIAALRYPGDADDDPTKVTAPYRVFSREELEALPQHTQFMLMNTHKSGDFYAEYAGVPMADLLDTAGILPMADSIEVHAPDGWSQFHPLDPDPDPLFYAVYQDYQEAIYFYDEEADEALNHDGWCDYSAPSTRGRQHGEVIDNPDGLKMILAYLREGEYLESGELTVDNKLDGEGPFRVVPPQKLPGPPDQSVKSDNQDVIWPFDDNADHNAGFATRSATMIRVDPLPEGTRDVNTLEAGWNFVDENKIIVYGAIDPRPTILTKIDELMDTVDALVRTAFKRPFLKCRLLWKIYWLRLAVEWEKDHRALNMVEKRLLPKVDGCTENEAPDRHDWIRDCEAQTQIYWALHELDVLLEILN